MSLLVAKRPRYALAITTGFAIFVLLIFLALNWLITSYILVNLKAYLKPTVYLSLLTVIPVFSLLFSSSLTSIRSAPEYISRCNLNFIYAWSLTGITGIVIYSMGFGLGMLVNLERIQKIDINTITHVFYSSSLLISISLAIIIASIFIIACLQLVNALTVFFAEDKD